MAGQQNFPQLCERLYRIYKVAWNPTIGDELDCLRDYTNVKVGMPCLLLTHQQKQQWDTYLKGPQKYVRCFCITVVLKDVKLLVEEATHSWHIAHCIAMIEYNRAKFQWEQIYGRVNF